MLNGAMGTWERYARFGAGALRCCAAAIPTTPVSEEPAEVHTTPTLRAAVSTTCNSRSRVLASFARATPKTTLRSKRDELPRCGHLLDRAAGDSSRLGDAPSARPGDALPCCRPIRIPRRSGATVARNSHRKGARRSGKVCGRRTGIARGSQRCGGLFPQESRNVTVPSRTTPVASHLDPRDSGIRPDWGAKRPACCVGRGRVGVDMFRSCRRQRNIICETSRAGYCPRIKETS